MHLKVKRRQRQGIDTPWLETSYGKVTKTQGDITFGSNLIGPVFSVLSLLFSYCFLFALCYLIVVLHQQMLHLLCTNVSKASGRNGGATSLTKRALM